MKLQDKLNYLQEKHMSEWLRTRRETENEVSDGQSMYCVCGKLATGLHEMHCKKFRRIV
jgi:hypothetical protein